MTIDSLKELLRQYHIKPSDKLGQNFLLDDIILQDMVEASGTSKSDVVIEIGAGIGNLTRYLAEKAKHVVAIEKDPRMVPILKDLQSQHKNVEVHHDDALHFDYSQLAKAPLATRMRVVANIPYYITGKLIHMLLKLGPKPKSITLLVQKEVAENIVAQPGALSILALSVQIYGHPKIMAPVPAEKFYPAPKVDSSVVHIDIPEQPPYAIPDEKFFFKVVKACFSGKRKQIHNTLKNNLRLSAEVVTSILSQTGIPSEARPQQLSINQWISLVNAIYVKDHP